MLRSKIQSSLIYKLFDFLLVLSLGSSNNVEVYQKEHNENLRQSSLCFYVSALCHKRLTREADFGSFISVCNCSMQC